LKKYSLSLRGCFLPEAIPKQEIASPPAAARNDKGGDVGLREAREAGFGYEHGGLAPRGTRRKS